MPISNGYATLDQLKSWLTSTASNDDVKLEAAVEAASRWIDTHCQRHFWQTAVGTARVFSPTSCEVLYLGPFNDATAVTAVAVDVGGDGTFETAWTVDVDYELLPLNRLAAPEERPATGLRALARRFAVASRGAPRAGRVRVTGTWGWPAVPRDVTHACLIQAARLYKRRDSPEGVAGFGEFGSVRIRSVDPDVEALLAPYQHPAVAPLVA